jgi:hypothetical protein
MTTLASRQLGTIALMLPFWPGCGGGEFKSNPIDAGAPEAEAGPLEVTLPIVGDFDDGDWIGGTNEQLRHSATSTTIQVGVGAEASRAGLRFQVRLPKGAIIQSARLHLYRAGGQTPPTDTIEVQVYDSGQVPAFADAHVHTPDAHAPEGLWLTAVTGFVIGPNDSEVDSPEIANLVRHVLDRADWKDGGHIGFVLTPYQMHGWAAFTDSSASDGRSATLRIKYAAP